MAEKYVPLNARTSQVALVAKSLPANVGDVRDVGSISGLEDPLEEGTATLSSFFCLENSMDRGDQQVIVHRAA